MKNSTEATVTITSGKIEGLHKEGIYIFKGIPYAASPIGEKRWLPPEPVKSWNGVRNAKEKGNIAPQNETAFPILHSLEILGQEVQNEDCLNLNVWSPGLDSKRRPVMFWIHGGGFSTGAGSRPSYNGEILARRGDVVVVTINYRLGALGFLNFNEITGGKIPSTGNEGLLDQVAALKWVRDNIEVFGGNSENVTIFGESAGGMSVGTLLAFPSAKGLFHKAICQSGAASNALSTEDAKKIAGLFIETLSLSGEDISVLQKFSIDKLLAAQMVLPQKTFRSDLKITMPFQPVIDGKVLPDKPLKLIEGGSANSVPLMVGTTEHEWNLLGMADTGLATLDEAGLVKRLEKLLPNERMLEAIEIYRRNRSKGNESISPTDVFSAIQTDSTFWIPAVQLLEAQRKQNQNVFSYLYTWKSPAMKGKLGACHAIEIGFVFGTYESNFCGTGPDADALSLKTQDAWIAFARTGNPSCSSLGEWPRYGKQRETMSLGKECSVVKEPFKEELRFWNSLKASTFGVI